MNVSLTLETQAFERWTSDILKGMTSEEGRRKALHGIALDFLARVIKRTPVDTGRARAGWHSYLLATGSLMKAGAAVARGEDAEAIKLGRSEGFFSTNFRGKNASIEIVNAVPYIVFLEFGYSKQAPTGMMRVTMREMRQAGVLSAQLEMQLEKTVAQANRTFRSRYRRLPG